MRRCSTTSPACRTPKPISNNWCASWAPKAQPARTWTSGWRACSRAAIWWNRGDLVEPRPGHYVATARAREYAIGRINMHRDGYGFLLSERPVEGIQGDVYTPADSARKAMHGDRVLVRIARIEPDGRADGEIVKVLK